MIIDYEKLADDYQNGLFTMLRGFGTAAGFLDTWVPDADPIKSICNMLDAASVAKLQNIVIFIGRETAARIDQEALLNAADDFGQASIKPKDDGLLLTVAAIDEEPAQKEPASKEASRPDEYIRMAKAAGQSWNMDFISQPAVRRKIAQAGKTGVFYAKAAAKAGGHLAHEGELKKEKDCVLAAGECKGARLALLMNKDNHLIVKAAHGGADKLATRALLEKMCEIIEGLPIQEASDHGVIRLEFELRDKYMPRPVPGIVTPEAADEAFLLPLELIREVMACYRRETGYGLTENAYDGSPAKEWLALSDEERRLRLGEVIARIAKENGFPPSEVEIAAIEFDVRVVLRLRGSLAAADQQRLLMKLERGIKDGIDRRLELFLEEIKDINKIRRLGKETAAPCPS